MVSLLLAVAAQLTLLLAAAWMGRQHDRERNR